MQDTDGHLTGRTELVTGAAKRLGRTISLALAQSGVRLLVHYNRSSQEALALCEKIQQAGGAAWPVCGNLSEPDQAEAVFREAVAKAGPIDILVNNASIFERDTLWEATDQSIRRNLHIHAVAPLILARQFARQGGEGHIVNLLDTRITVYDKEHASYHISKRMLLTLTRMLAQELAPKIAVNAVAPGLILPPEGQDESYLKKLVHTNPLHRHGEAADIVQAVLFLLRSRFITGQVIFVYGGYHMKGHMYD